MRMRLQSILFFIVILITFVEAHAQSCDGDFDRISVECIKKKNLNYETAAIHVTAGMNNNVYFYKTYRGELGKLKVIGSTVTNRECTLLIDAVTYSQDKSFVPNSSISISVANNHWLPSKIYLDKGYETALEMIRTNKIIEAEKTKAAEEEKAAKNGKTASKTKLADKSTENEPSPYYCILQMAVYKGEEGADENLDVGIAKFRREKTAQELREEAKPVMLFYAPLVLIFIAIFLVVKMFMDEQEKHKTSEALEEAENTNKGKAQPLFIKITKPFYKRYFLPMVQGFKNKQGLKTKYRQKLANAGLLKDITPEEFMAMKIFMILGGPFVFLTVRFVLEEQWPLAITPVMGVAGFIYPNIWLSGTINRRGTEIIRAMPFIVDMLALSVEAGLDFMAAIQRVIEKAPPSPLVEEFETLIKETRIGSSRAEGLRQLGWRVNIIEINSFCATLIAADSVGASIAPILKQLSAELRVKRSSRAEQQGATAATKILIPMIFFILPAVLVAIFAPMVLKMMTGKL